MIYRIKFQFPESQNKNIVHFALLQRRKLNFRELVTFQMEAEKEIFFRGPIEWWIKEINNINNTLNN